MLTNARDALTKSPSVAVFPGLFIALTVLAFILVGNALRDALDPRLTK
jgi:ABC-type dipeptide/oligopeptide/nickel transport system permease subunit